MTFFSISCWQVQKEHVMDCLSHFTHWSQASMVAHLRPHSIFDARAFAANFAPSQSSSESYVPQSPTHPSAMPLKRSLSLSSSRSSGSAVSSSSSSTTSSSASSPTVSSIASDFQIPTRGRLLWAFARAALLHVRQRSHLALFMCPPLVAHAHRIREEYVDLLSRYLLAGSPVHSEDSTDHVDSSSSPSSPSTLASTSSSGDEVSSEKVQTTAAIQLHPMLTPWELYRLHELDEQIPSQCIARYRVKAMLVRVLIVLLSPEVVCPVFSPYFADAESHVCPFLLE
jgi:hypothetical protein